MKTQLPQRATLMGALLVCGLTANAQSTPQTTKTELRNRIVNAARQTSATYGQTMRITSTDRTTPRSAAHDRGAIDIAGTNYNIARGTSRTLGRGFTAIVEQPKQPPCAPGHQLSSSYRNGQPVSSQCLPLRATGPHTHIQPDANPNSDAPHSRAGSITVCADCGRSAKDFGSVAAFQRHLAQGHATRLKANQSQPASRKGYPNPRPNSPTPRQ